MACDHRKPLVLPKIGTNSDGGFLNPCPLSCNRQTNPFGFCLASCFNVCPQVCKNLVSVFDDPLCPPSPPLPPPPPPYLRPVLPSRVTNRDALFTKPAVKFGLIFMAAVITGVFLLGLIWQAWRFYKSRQNDSSRRRNPPILFHTQESFGDESQGPEIDHPIWYINTVGLRQSIIDSIAICKYKKGEGLIEGTDCSVCLSEFEEDESLRLLPKCSHAFHITCIDTWLRSHKNCPLCRAPIVCHNYAVQAQSSSEPNSIDLDSSEEAEEENMVNNDIALVSEQVGGGETSGLRIGDHNRPAEADNNVQDLRNKSKRSISRNYPSRVQSDLAENRQASTEGEVQPMRRSLSMDSLSAMRIYNAVANVVPDNHSVGIKNSKSNISSSKRRSGSFGVLKLMSNSSIGPILMKKSSSSCGKASSSSRRNRSHDSILPL